MFTTVQLDKLRTRLLQTKEELLYDARSRQTERYRLTQREGTILGVAHCDYVEDAWSYPTLFDNSSKLRAGQVDDRVGVWLLLDVLPAIIPTFDVLLTTDDEIGCSSAGEVDELLAYNWTFQFDRRGTDFVDYDLSSKKFKKAFQKTTGIREGIGSFSDICMLPDSCGSRVNIGTAYYNEHTPDAHVDLIECYSQVMAFAEFAKQYADDSFPCTQQRRKPKLRGWKYSSMKAFSLVQSEILPYDPNDDLFRYDLPDRVTKVICPYCDTHECDINAECCDRCLGLNY